MALLVLYADKTAVIKHKSFSCVQNYCVRGLELFASYLFQDILELYDWNLTGTHPKQRAVCAQPLYKHRSRLVSNVIWLVVANSSAVFRSNMVLKFSCGWMFW